MGGDYHERDTFDRPFRWQRAAEGLHAIPIRSEQVFPGDEIETLCGITAILTRADFARRLSNGSPPPTCLSCTHAWIAHETARRPSLSERDVRSPPDLGSSNDHSGVHEGTRR